MTVRTSDTLTPAHIPGPEEDDLERSLLDDAAGKELMRADAANPEPVMVAGRGKMGKFLRDFFPKPKRPRSGWETREKVEEREAEAAIPKVSEEEAQTLREQSAIREMNVEEGVTTLSPRPAKEGVGRNINLDYIQNPEDWAGVLDEIQPDLPNRGVRSFEQVREGVDEDPAKVLAPLLKGAQNPRPLTDKQMYAARSFTLTLTDNVRTLRDKILSGRASKEDELEFRKLQAAYTSWMAFLQGSITETARGLNSMKMVADVLKNPNIQSITAAHGEQGGTDSAISMAKLMLEYEEAAGGDAVAGLANLSKVTWTQRAQTVVSLWQASILTGFGTHAVNASANGVVQAYESLLIKPLAGVVGAGRTMLPGANPDRVYTGEAGAEIVGTIASLWDATKLAAYVLKEGARTGDFRPEAVKGTIGGSKVYEAQARGQEEVTLGAAVTPKGTPKAITGTLDVYERIIRTASFGVLGATDQFYKEITYNKTLYSLAYRQAKSEGLSGDDLTNRMSQILDDPPAPMHKQAIDEADRQTFTERPELGIVGDSANAIANFANKYPPLKFIVPFIRTPANIVRYAAENTVLAPFAAKWRADLMAGGARRDMAVARLTAGSVQLAAVWGLYESGVITGAGPANFQQREALERTGWKPNSIYIDGKYYNYDRMDPFGMMIGVIADARDAVAYAPDENSASTVGAAALFMMAHYATDATYLRGISDIMGAVNSPTGGIAYKYASNVLSGYVPGLAKSVADVVGGDPRKARFDPNNPLHTFAQAFSKRTPWMQENVPPKRHWDGEPVTGHNNVLVRTVSPVKPTSNKPVRWTDLNDEEQFKAQDNASVEMVKHGVTAGEPPVILSAAGLQIPLLAIDDGKGFVYDKYFELVGKQRRKLVEAVIASDGYEELSDGPRGEKYLLLERALTQAQRAALPEFLEWMAVQLDNPENEYADIAYIFSANQLNEVARDIRNGTLEVPSLKGFRGRGVPSSGELPEPPHMRSTPRF